MKALGYKSPRSASIILENLISNGLRVLNNEWFVSNNEWNAVNNSNYFYPITINKKENFFDTEIIFYRSKTRYIEEKDVIYITYKYILTML